MKIFELLLSNIGLPLVERFSSTQFWSLYKGMKTLQASSDEIVAKKQNEKIKRLLDEARDHTQYWSAKINRDDTSLTSVPTSLKQTYISGFPDEVTVKNSQKDWQYLSSAGTTDRMTVVVNFDKRDYLRAAEHLNLLLATGGPIGNKAVDIPPSACNVVCGFADEGPEPLWHYLYWSLKNKKLWQSDTLSNLRGRIERQVLLQREVLLPINSATWDKMTPQLDEYLDKLHTDKVQILRGLPHFMLWLAVRAQQRQLHFPALKTLLPYGGLAGRALIKRIETAFGAKFVNVYGTGEVGSIGCATNGSDIVDVYADMVCLEVLDEQGQAVAEGEVGNVVVTDLNNFAMPIIRYAIGDVAEVVESNRVNGFPKKIRILGRVQECINTSTGDRVTSSQIQDVFFAIDPIINYKIEFLSAKLVKVTVVALGEYDEDKLKSTLQQLLSLAKPPTIKRSEFILPEASGKYLSISKKKGM